MIPTGAQATPMTTAGRVKRWIVQSIASASREAGEPKRHRVASDVTISTSTLAVLLDRTRKNAHKTTRFDNVIHDVVLPSETKTPHRHPTDIADSSGSSSSSSSSSGHADSESASTHSSPEYQEPPSLSKRHCEECHSELGENEACACIPGIAVVPPIRVPSPLLPYSTSSPEPSRGDSGSVHTSDAGQIPDEDIQVEIADLKQEADTEHAEYASSPWGQPQEEGCGWWDHETLVTSWTVTNEIKIQTEGPKTSSPSPAFDGQEPQDPSTCVSPSTTPTLLASSDGRMTLTLQNFLGAGSHGTVVSADWAERCRQVAVKVSHKLFISELDCSEPGLKHLKNELDVLKALKQSREYHELGSNFFPELFKSWQDDKNVYFVMDLYPWNLEELRWADADWDASEGDKVLWAAEMILGVQALHRMRILHRDIKPANVFVTSTRHLIIGDYGLAQAWLDPFYADFPPSSLRARDAPGTMLYLAPEVVKGFYEDAANAVVRKYANYGFEADIWSLGVTICDSWRQSKGLFGIQEGDGDQDPNSAIPPKILQMDTKLAVKQIVDGHPICHLITRMLDRNPKTRIGFNEILAHPVFALLDWNKVANLEYIPTWNYPEAESSKQPKPIQEEIDFPYYYQSPDDICVNDTDSERTRADKLERQHGQALRRAMGAARDWVSKQCPWVKDEALGEYDFDWTAPEVIAEDEGWVDDD